MSILANDIIAIIGPKGIPKDFPGTGGIEAYIENQIPDLVKKGNPVYCYTRYWTSQKHKTSYKGARIIALPTINTTILDALSYSFLATIHATLSRATIIWYHGIGPAFFSFIPKLRGKKVYVTIHSLDWRRKKWGAMARLFLHLCELVTITFSDRLFVVSTQLETYIKFRHHKNTQLNKYPHVRLPAATPNIISRKYHLTKNSYILFLGRFVPEKRIDWLISAIQENPTITLVLAGGSSHSDAYARRLTTLARHKNVIFTGWVFGREKAELFSNCRLVVLPSMLEGYPVSIAEALAYRKPCLIENTLQSEYPSANTLLHYFKQDNYRDFKNHLNRLLKA